MQIFLIFCCNFAFVKGKWLYLALIQSRVFPCLRHAFLRWFLPVRGGSLAAPTAASAPSDFWVKPCVSSIEFGFSSAWNGCLLSLSEASSRQLAVSCSPKKTEKRIQLKDLREKKNNQEVKINYNLKLILMHPNSFSVLAGLEIPGFSHLSRGELCRVASLQE